MSPCAELERLPLVTLYLSERCNSRCVGCDYWRHGRADLGLAAVEALLPDLAALQTRDVLISGGEPLLNAQWPSICRLLRAHGMRLWLLTSGLALGRHAERVAGLFAGVTVSLDGACRGTYRATRGIDAFASVCRGIAAAARRGIPTQLRATLQRGNFRELAALVDLAHELGAGRISFLAADVRSSDAFGRHGAPSSSVALTAEQLPEFERRLHDLERTHAADFSSGFIAESPAKLRRVLQYYRALLGLATFPPVHCNAPEFSAVMDASGHLRPCFFIGGPREPAAPFQLAASLNSRGMAGLRDAIRGGLRAECQRCVCSMWRDPALQAAGLPA